MRNWGKNRQRRGLPPPCGIHPAVLGVPACSLFRPWSWWGHIGGVKMLPKVPAPLCGCSSIARALLWCAAVPSDPGHAVIIRAFPDQKPPLCKGRWPGVSRDGGIDGTSLLILLRLSRCPTQTTPQSRRCGLCISRLAPERRGQSRSRRRTSSPHRTRLRWASAGTP